MAFEVQSSGRSGIGYRAFIAAVAIVGCAWQANASGPNLLTNPGLDAPSLGSAGGYVCTSATTAGSCTSNIPGWGVNGDHGGNASTQAVPFAPQASWNSGGSGSQTAWIVAPGINTFNHTIGFYVSPGVSPDGGDFVALDGDSTYASSIWQTVSGLTVGAQYTLQFYQAAAQQNGTTGATTERWSVSFGSSTQLSTLMNNVSHGSVAWNQQTMTFTATAATQTLNFFAVGTPSGQPPVVLLDGISLTAVPEPASIALLGVGALALVARRKKRANPA